MRLGCAGEPHLTYCTNIHPGESWAEVFSALDAFVPAVKARVSPEAPFAVGLRLSARAATELLVPQELDRFRGFLAERALYVPTINGFPHGAFHGVAVKEAVYLPDWRDPARLAYTCDLADILAALLPEDGHVTGSISTVPGAFRPAIQGPADVERMASHLRKHAAHLHALRERTGKTISLALEPEPFCYLETASEAVAFFERHLFTRESVSRFAALAGTSLSVAEEALRRHLGVCYDTCHGAVLHEDPAGALRELRRAGIRVGKLQLTAGLEVDFAALGADEAARRGLLRALRPFAEGVYLHQVMAREGEGLYRALDLPEALAEAERDPSRPTVWRIHFHVPVFREVMGPFRNTQPFLRDLLAIVKEEPISDTLEVETYTWDVLPPEHRTEAVSEAIARELDWVRGRLSR